MTPTCRLLLVSGSLRSRSTSTAVLRTASVVAPRWIDALVYGQLGDLPHFNPDDEVAPLHPAVAGLRDHIRGAGAVLFSTPEYAGALPGSFKNLLDWTIGDDRAGSIYEKPVAWINPSPRGAAAAHESLRTVLGYAHATIVKEACAAIPVTAGMLGMDGLVADLDVRDQIAVSLRALANHACGRPDPEHIRRPG